MAIELIYPGSRGSNADQERDRDRDRDDDSYWLSMCRHGSEIDNMEVRFLTAETRGPSLRVRFYLLLSLSPC